MGVPAFFRWLTKKYPSVVADCVEDRVNELSIILKRIHFNVMPQILYYTYLHLFLIKFQFLKTFIFQPKQLPNGKFLPVDASQKNPNNVEFHNLYLDMNGIIHPCTHPEDR